MNKLFGLNGITGLLLAVVLLLVIVFALGYKSILVQQDQATNFYTIDRNAVQMNSADNAQHYKTVKE